MHGWGTLKLIMGSNGQPHQESDHGQRLKGKVAIITGGARGIGAATAKLFTLHGAHVIIADILDDIGPNLADSIGARYVHCNVASEADVESAVQLALACHGRLDVMFSNAGIAGPHGSITRLDMGEVQALISVNVAGMMHGIKHAARVMVSGGGGSIICTSSSAAMIGGLAGHAYSLSKGAVLGLAKSAACELGPKGIRVNCILPHGVPSEMVVEAYRELTGRTDVGREDLGRMMEASSLLPGRCADGRMEDIARAALFLASDESGFVTGHNLVVDGGYTSVCRTMSYIYK